MWRNDEVMSVNVEPWASVEQERPKSLDWSMSLFWRERERERERDGVFKILNFPIRLYTYLNCKSSITYIISIVQKIYLNDHDCNKLKGANYIRSTTQINLKCLSLYLAPHLSLLLVNPDVQTL